MRAELGADGARRADDTLLAAISSARSPTRCPRSAALRERGVRLVVVSNWDVSLHEQLTETGLAPLLDGAVASAEIGAAKPDPRSSSARSRSRARAGRALHVGDDVGADVGGAPRPGSSRCSSTAPASAGPRRAPIASLAELPALSA